MKNSHRVVAISCSVTREYYNQQPRSIMIQVKHKERIKDTSSSKFISLKHKYITVYSSAEKYMF